MLLRKGFSALDSRLRIASALMGIGQYKEGFYHLDIFFAQPYAQKMKYVYKRYIELDKNFKEIRREINRRYYEQKGEN